MENLNINNILDRCEKENIVKNILTSFENNKNDLLLLNKNTFSSIYSYYLIS
jgi:hypothetical protein